MVKNIDQPTRHIKNWIGSLGNFGNCPNCGDSIYWKPMGSLKYKVGNPISYSVSICQECLDHPEGLDEERIARNLVLYGWEQPGITFLVQIAVRNYKNCGVRSISVI